MLCVCARAVLVRAAPSACTIQRVVFFMGVMLLLLLLCIGVQYIFLIQKKGANVRENRAESAKNRHPIIIITKSFRSADVRMCVHMYSCQCTHRRGKFRPCRCQ